MTTIRWAPRVTILAVFLQASALEAQSSRLVDVGSHVLHATVSGQGGPVVVLEAAAGENLDTWDQVSHRIAEFTTVVAYSRAGYGRSGVSDREGTPLRVSQELGQLLDGLEIHDPVILVGHSSGGLYSRVFAAQQPDRIAALVLLDATHERQFHEYSQLSSTFWEDMRKGLDDLAASKGGAMASEIEAVWPVLQRGTLPEAYPLPDVPTLVLTAQRADSTSMLDTQRGQDIKRKFHRDFLAFHAGARQLLVPESGHYIHRDAPTLVVEVIHQIVLSLRDGT